MISIIMSLKSFSKKQNEKFTTLITTQLSGNNLVIHRAVNLFNRLEISELLIDFENSNKYMELAMNLTDYSCIVLTINCEIDNDLLKKFMLKNKQYFHKQEYYLLNNNLTSVLKTNTNLDFIKV